MVQPFPAHKLGPYLEQIALTQPLVQRITFCPNDWNTLPLQPALSQLQNSTEIIANGYITRGDVTKVGNLAVSERLGWDAFFVSVMIWGFGTVGYGRWRTEQMMATQDFNNIFNNIRTNILLGAIAQAYGAPRINRCGPPFLTKILYFLGKVFCTTNPLPLILDSRVVASLTKCNGNGFAATNYYRTNASGRYLQGYIDYCNDLHSWSQEHNFRPDQLELFLFCPPVGF